MGSRRLWRVLSETTPTVITLLGSLPLGDEEQPGLIQTATHELMHAWQKTFEYDVDEYHWLEEATAYWAQRHVYPKARTPKGLEDYFFKLQGRSLSDKVSIEETYSAYLLPWFLVQHYKVEPTVVGQMWANATNPESLTAVKSAIASAIQQNQDTIPYAFPSFEDAWLWFLFSNWDAAETLYHKDGIDGGVVRFAEVHWPIGGQLHRYDIFSGDDANLPPLSARYYRYTFTDSVRLITFYNGLNFALRDEQMSSGDRRITWDASSNRDKVSVQVIIEQDEEGSLWPENISTQPVRAFCRDDKKQEIWSRQLVFIFSNVSDTEMVAPEGLSPTLLISELPCQGYKGSVSTHIEGTCGGACEIRTDATAEVTLNAKSSANEGPTSAPVEFDGYIMSIVSSGSFCGWKYDPAGHPDVYSCDIHGPPFSYSELYSWPSIPGTGDALQIYMNVFGGSHFGAYTAEEFGFRKTYFNEVQQCAESFRSGSYEFISKDGPFETVDPQSGEVAGTLTIATCPETCGIGCGAPTTFTWHLFPFRVGDEMP